VIDIIGLTDAILNIAEIGEASDHIGNRHARNGRMRLIAIEREIGANDIGDTVFLLIVSVDFDESDIRERIEFLVDFDLLGMGAFFEEFRIAEFLDVFLGEFVILDESFAGFVGENLTIGTDEVLGENAAIKTIINA